MEPNEESPQPEQAPEEGRGGANAKGKGAGNGGSIDKKAYPAGKRLPPWEAAKSMKGAPKDN